MPAAKRIAFVLGGGGGPFGAHEVGMLRALIERDIVPDLVLGTSIGAINGVAIAADPSAAGIERLTDAWSDIDRSQIFDSSVVRQLARLARTRTHLHSNAWLCTMLGRLLPVERIEDLGSRFSASPPASSVPASTGSPTGRSSRPWWPRLGARAAGPGEDRRRALHRRRRRQQHPAEPGDRARRQQVYVLHVGRLDRPLEPPRSPWEVALVAFEIARRHRFVGDLAMIPSGIDVHVWRPVSRTRRASPTARSFATATRRSVARAHQPCARGVRAVPRRGRAAGRPAR